MTLDDDDEEKRTARLSLTRASSLLVCSLNDRQKHLLDELRKFSTRALDNSLIYDQGLRHPGESCLRTVIVQIHKLCAELQAFRPAVAKKCLSSLETGAY